MHHPSPAIHPTVSADLLQRIRSAKSGDAFRDAILIGVDLREANLSALDLSGADLSGADLSDAQLVGTILEGAVLHQTKLCRAELAGANLRKSDLSHVDASRAGLGHADLSHARALDANFEHASLIEANLSGSDVRGSHCHSARFCRATLHRANFDRADLQEADLSQADLSSAHFVEADLRRARFRGARGFKSANFIHSNIQEVDFSGAYMVRRFIVDQNYLHEFRNQSRLSALWYWIWWATSDCGRSLLRWTSWTIAITVLFGYAYQFLALDYGAYQTALSPYYFSLVTLTTLGFGDVLPASLAAQALVMIEVVMGYLMLGGLLSLFASKMGRRSE